MPNSLLNDRRGNVAILFGMVLPVLASAAAIAIDYTALSMERMELQGAADAAALAGAHAMTLAYSQSGSVREKEGRNAAEAFVLAKRPDATRTISASLAEKIVTVTLETDKELMFGGFFDQPHSRVVSSAVATLENPRPACVVSLGRNSAPGVETTGAGKLEADKCSVWSNSSTSSSMSFAGKIAQAKRFCAVGTASGSSTPRAESRCEAAPNPFAHVTVPNGGPCTSGSVNTASSGSISPGTYCGNITVTGGITTMEPGTYFIRNGVLDIKSNSELRGTGVTIVLEGTSTLNWSGNTRIHLSPQTTGPLAGLTIVSDPNGPKLGSTLSGNNTSGPDAEFFGSIYLPNHQLTLTGSASLIMNGDRSKVVSRAVSLGGSSRLVMRADDMADVLDALRKLRLLM